MSYKIIYGANVAISMADLKGDDPLTNQLKGRKLFSQGIMPLIIWSGFLPNHTVMRINRNRA